MICLVLARAIFDGSKRFVSDTINNMNSDISFFCCSVVVCAYLCGGGRHFINHLRSCMLLEESAARQYFLCWWLVEFILVHKLPLAVLGLMRPLNTVADLQKLIACGTCHKHTHTYIPLICREPFAGWAACACNTHAHTSSLIACASCGFLAINVAALGRSRRRHAKPRPKPRYADDMVLLMGIVMNRFRCKTCD